MKKWSSQGLQLEEKMQKKFILVCISSFLVILGTNALAVEKQVIAGAGPTTKIVQTFFEEFSKQPAAAGYQFRVPLESAKHAGGIKATDHYLFGRTGRPLTWQEKKMNKGEIFLAKIPICIATGADVPTAVLDLQQLEYIFTGVYTNWNQVLGVDVAITVVGREETEAAFTTLKAKYPFFGSGKFNKVFRKDHHVVKFLQGIKGRYAIGFGAEPNFKDEENINIVRVSGFDVGLNLGLVYDLANREHALVQAVIAYAGSEAWKNTVTAMGYSAPGN